jgi:acetyl-CoA synthetase
MSDIEVNKEETRIFSPSPEFSQKANIKNLDQYQNLCKEAENDYVGFWARHAREQLIWQHPFTKILNEDNPPFYKWFEDGLLNASYNCLDRHLSNGNAEKTALIFEADDGKVTTITYRDLHQRVCQFANGLKSLGIQTGDRVIIYMPMSIEGIVAMQACARIGATHSVVFGGFSAKSLQDRIIDAQARAIITADFQCRAGKKLPLKSVVDEALDNDACPTVQHVIIYQRTQDPLAFHPKRDILLGDVLKNQPYDCEPTWVNAEHSLFILYTSGSTGAPKGVQHSTAGYLLWATLTMQWVFDITPNDIFWCTADIGWITGHTYVAYGPLSVGTTQVIFEGVPTYPNAGRFWEMIDKHQVNIFYTAPTAIRSLIKAANTQPEVAPSNYSLKSLRLLGSVGEPINPEAWMWYYQEVGHSRCPIVDTFWQTETGGHMISPLPGATPLTPGSCTLPLPGIMTAIVDETGKTLPKGHGGMLVVTRPWPSMIRTIWNNPERFVKSYFPTELGGNLYLAGDGAICNQHTGYYTITGRIDDVLNVSGHRMGTMEIESALVAHPLVAEAAVVGKPDEITGESICAFVVLKQARPNTKESANQAALELRQWVAKEIGAIAKPKEIRFGDNLPKTRSGKIMRRLLRVLAKGEPITQDVSTLENPLILEQLSEIQ